MPFNCADAQEEFRTDLGVRPPLTREPGDVLFLGREVVARFEDAFSHFLAGREQLATRALGERLGSHFDKRVVRNPELLARINSPVLTTEPLAVDKMRSGKLRPKRHTIEARDRHPVPLFGRFAAAEQRLAS
jgi:hypothetical protein